MNLNAEIIYDKLRQQVPVEMKGHRSDDLLLGRPTYLLGTEKVLSTNKLYFALADRLPLQPQIKENVVLICIGQSQRLSYYQERCCVLHIKEKADFFQVANVVQELFDFYAAWDESLQAILAQTASVQELIEQCYAVFENPLFVINADFKVIAHTGYEGINMPYALESTNVDNLSLPTLAQFLELHELSMDTKDPMLLNLLDSSTLNTNIFVNDEYQGCLTIDYHERRHTSSDIALAKYTAQSIAQAFDTHSSATQSERSMMKHALQDLVEGLPISLEQQRALEAVQESRFVCVKLQLESRVAKLPTAYICNEFESSFAGSIAFVHDSAVVGFIELDAHDATQHSDANMLKEQLTSFILAMDMRVGVGDTFSDLLNARLHYKQTSQVLECGRLVQPQDRYYVFEELALTELIVNAIGELPYEMYFSEAMRKLAEHDAHAEVSYLETLRVYLENNMSVSKTAEVLYIHRSTLLERLSRIKRELGRSLQDPDERLRIAVALKAQQIYDKIRNES